MPQLSVRCFLGCLVYATAAAALYLGHERFWIAGQELRIALTTKRNTTRAERAPASRSVAAGEAGRRARLDTPANHPSNVRAVLVEHVRSADAISWIGLRDDLPTKNGDEKMCIDPPPFGQQCTMHKRDAVTSCLRQQVARKIGEHGAMSCRAVTCPDDGPYRKGVAHLKITGPICQARGAAGLSRRSWSEGRALSKGHGMCLPGGCDSLFLADVMLHAANLTGRMATARTLTAVGNSSSVRAGAFGVVIDALRAPSRRLLLVSTPHLQQLQARVNLGELVFDAPVRASELVTSSFLGASVSPEACSADVVGSPPTGNCSPVAPHTLLWVYVLDLEARGQQV